MPRGSQKNDSKENNNENKTNNHSSSNSGKNDSGNSNHSFHPNAKLHIAHVSEGNYRSRVVHVSEVMHTDRSDEHLYISAHRTFLHRPAGPTEYNGIFVLERWRLAFVLPFSQS